MFGSKKSKKEALTRAESEKQASFTPPKTANCPLCNAVCTEADGQYKCSFCGHKFTEAEVVLKAASVAKKQAMVMESVSLERSAEDIYEMNCRGVVEICTDSGLASGFIISNKGLVLTNAHAILDQKQEVCTGIFVKFGEELIRAHVIAMGDTNGQNGESVDLALLVMESMPEEATSLQLGISSNLRIGQHVYYIGNSKGEGLCMTAGIISDNFRKVENRYYIMTDAATNPGNSGGPLFNDDGQVIGVHVSARVQADGMKYAIPMDTVRAFLNFVEDQLKIPHDSLADNLYVPPVMAQGLTTGTIVTLVLAGITVLVSNIEYIIDIIEAING